MISVQAADLLQTYHTAMRTPPEPEPAAPGPKKKPAATRRPARAPDAAAHGEDAPGRYNLQQDTNRTTDPEASELDVKRKLHQIFGEGEDSDDDGPELDAAKHQRRKRAFEFRDERH